VAIACVSASCVLLGTRQFHRHHIQHRTARRRTRDIAVEATRLRKRLLGIGKTAQPLIGEGDAVVDRRQSHRRRVAVHLGLEDGQHVAHIVRCGLLDACPARANSYSGVFGTLCGGT
jgi:hypothetical protein